MGLQIWVPLKNPSNLSYLLQPSKLNCLNIDGKLLVFMTTFITLKTFSHLSVKQTKKKPNQFFSHKWWFLNGLSLLLLASQFLPSNILNKDTSTGLCGIMILQFLTFSIPCSTSPNNTWNFCTSIVFLMQPLCPFLQCFHLASFHTFCIYTFHFS